MRYARFGHWLTQALCILPPPSIQIHSLHTNTFFCIYAREHRPLIDLIMRRRKTALKSYTQSTSNEDDGDDGYDGDHYNWDTEDGDDGDDEEDVRCKFDHLAFTTIHTWSVKGFHLLM